MNASTSQAGPVAPSLSLPAIAQRFPRRTAAVGLTILALATPGPARAAAAVLTAGMDYFNYGNSPAGTSTSIPVFAFLNSDDPDRLGQMVLGFDTAAAVPAGQGAASYVVTSVRLTLNLQNALIYDPTYDSVASYQLDGTDADAGRPYEVYSLGFRNGFTSVGFDAELASPPLFSEGSAFEPADATGTYVQHSFPITFGSGVPRADGDVTDSASEGWETEPFATGVIPGLAPGAINAANSQVVFTMNLADDSIRAYFQNGLNQGVIGLNVASLHPADGIGSGSYPRFSSRENTIPSRRPTLEIEYAVIPEPACILLAGAAAAIALVRRRRQANHIWNLSVTSL